MLTKTQLQVLRDLDKADQPDETSDEADESEIVCEGGICYLGYRRIAYKTVVALLDCTALSVSWRDDQGYTVYKINEVGRSITRRPELAFEVFAWIIGRKGSFTIENDRIKKLD